MSDGIDDLPEAVLEAIAVDVDIADARERQAAENRAKFEGYVRGAQARAGMLPRRILSDLAFGAADLMVMHIVTGRLKPKSADEAARVAQKMLEIARKETGEADTTVVIRSPEERNKALSEIREIMAIAREAKEAAAATAVAPTPEPLAIDAASTVHDPDLVAGGSIAQGTPSGVALRRVPSEK